MRGRNFTKPFSIAGLILGELYMLLVVLAPARRGPPAPLKLWVQPPLTDALPPDLATPAYIFIFKLIMAAIFFGIFGALVGGGIGLLVTGLLARRPPPGP
jgi:hypothetical protein